VDEGIIFLTGELGRGISLKMKNDAHVFVVSSENKFSESQVLQMIGRGSRSFGKCTGYIYIVFKYAALLLNGSSFE
jgi:late competence protein required for DNA uptake (superfamily II DNA/RNA helicase)